MRKYHVREDGSYGICRAKDGKCPLVNAEHCDTLEEAIDISNAVLSNTHEGKYFTDSKSDTLINGKGEKLEEPKEKVKMVIVDGIEVDETIPTKWDYVPKAKLEKMKREASAQAKKNWKNNKHNRSFKRPNSLDRFRYCKHRVRDTIEVKTYSVHWKKDREKRRAVMDREFGPGNVIASFEVKGFDNRKPVFNRVFDTGKVEVISADGNAITAIEPKEHTVRNLFLAADAPIPKGLLATVRKNDRHLLIHGYGRYDKDGEDYDKRVRYLNQEHRKAIEYDNIRTEELNKRKIIEDKIKREEEEKRKIEIEEENRLKALEQKESNIAKYNKKMKKKKLPKKYNRKR